MRRSVATPRVDGDETRQALIESAGYLAAQYGWAGVKAKDVCLHAQVSTASVNYWFGSREALYEAVLQEIPAGIMQCLNGIALSDSMSAKQALECFFDMLLQAASCQRQWRIRLWIREMFTESSPQFLLLYDNNEVLRLEFVKTLYARYLGCDPDADYVQTVMMMTLLPCLSALIVPGRLKQGLFYKLFQDTKPDCERIKAALMQTLKQKKKAWEKKKKEAA